MPAIPTYTAFAGPHRIAVGSPIDVAKAVRHSHDKHPGIQILVFDDRTSRQIELNPQGSPEQIAAQLEPAAQPADARGPGRPRLGVVAREVTLMPRHWDWLKAQRGGASAVLRRLVESAMHGNNSSERARQSSEAAYRFMHAMAGDRAGFEEALRAFYRGNRQQFTQHIARWPRDIREHASRLATMAWDDKDDAR
ncbi:MAG TPA: DUF2239 family protein [Oleiagrimonas sp.]|nr:DUF2239 family protein [Oleiagrimonas sp.]